MLKHLTVFSTVFALAILAAQPAAAATKTEELVIKAQFTVEAMIENQEFGPLARKFMKNAKGVVVIPTMVKGAFMFGGEGGSGVMLVRSETGVWSYPAFYTLGSVSWGLQIGGSVSQVMLLLMTDRGVKAIVEDKKLKLGADLGVALGPVGGGAEAGLTLGSVDVMVYSMSKGLYLGISLEGSIVEPRESLNEEYYGAPAITRPIVMEAKHINRHADNLRDALANISKAE